MDKAPNIRQGQGDGFRWDGVELNAYKEEGSAPFKAITRQVLFSARSCNASCAISRWRRAAIPRWSGTSTRTPS